MGLQPDDAFRNLNARNRSVLSPAGLRTRICSDLFGVLASISSAGLGGKLKSNSLARTPRLNQMLFGYSTSMPTEIVIRHARPDDNSAVHELVQTIADETFAYLFGTKQVPIGEANWFSAWLAILRGEIVGVTMTREEWVSDLWVRSDNRRTGIRTKLLAQAEREIRSRGHDTFRLRVVKSNTQAVEFYQSQGWRVHHEFPHEKFGHAMLEMIKLLDPIPVLQ